MLKKEIEYIKNKKTVSAGIGYTIGNILIMGISFLTIPIFTRILSTSDYGLYNTFMAYASICSILIGFGLHTSIKAANIEFDKRIDEYVSNIIILSMLLLVVFFAIVITCGGIVSNYFGYSQLLLIVLLLQSEAGAIISIYNNRLSLDYSYKKYLIVSFFTSVGSIVLSLIFIFIIFKNERYVGRILGGAIPSIISALIIIYLLFSKKKPTIKKDQIGFALKYSAPIVPHGLSQILLSQFDRIMIQRMIGSAQAGIYSFSYSIATIPQIIASSLDTVWGPWFFEQYKEQKIELIKKRSSQYVMLFSIITVGIMAVSPEIIHIMASKDYWESVYLVIPIVLSTYFIFLYYLPAQIEYYEKKTVNIAIGTMGAATLNIALNYIFIPKYGYIAAAYTTLFSYICNFVFHIIAAKKIAGVLPFAGSKILVQIITVCASAILIYFAIESIILRLLIVASASILLLVSDKTNIKVLMKVGKGDNE
ncbi:lipopolysaccharide biosynthesis protein [Haloimpatiens sp. FM7315]|uniref:lipopolysaccharide biosynthesis protein n=1 Tax=Haloimpatiens sp. FM7315 TaxID=3298609 RepID=UPI0035A3A6BD